MLTHSDKQAPSVSLPFPTVGLKLITPLRSIWTTTAVISHKDPFLPYICVHGVYVYMCTCISAMMSIVIVMCMFISVDLHMVGFSPSDLPYSRVVSRVVKQNALNNVTVCVSYM